MLTVSIHGVILLAYIRIIYFLLFGGERMEQHFNLLSEPWIKVIDLKSSEEKTVSLQELFDHAADYRQLAGDTRSQDLALLRFLLAILTTVYSRFDADDQPYDWLEFEDEFRVNPEMDVETEETEADLRETWVSLYERGGFTPVLIEYLNHWAPRFDLFGEKPFYQVSKADFDDHVPAKKRLTSQTIAKKTGTVAVKQLNRRISESNNSPALFAPKTTVYKNQITLPELARWLITYQNFTGVTDKTKVEAPEKFSISPGWLYKLNPIYLAGANLFETLMMNLVLYEDVPNWSPMQKPVWEFDHVSDYVTAVQVDSTPDNLAELYTLWSRLLHIEWQADEPVIFSAGLPMPSPANAFIEPMTTWRLPDKQKEIRPATRNLQHLGEAMWHNFGQYVPVNTEHDLENGHQRVPGVVTWLEEMKEEAGLDSRILSLISVALISDGNATSQSPAAEYSDDLTMNSRVLFDQSTVNYWPQHIEEVIENTQTVGNDYFVLARQVAELRNFDAPAEFANRMRAKFYDRLNEPFKAWLASLSRNDDRNEKKLAWYQQLKQIVNQTVDEELKQTAGPRDFRGVVNEAGSQSGKASPENIFIAIGFFKGRLAKHLASTGVMK